MAAQDFAQIEVPQEVVEKPLTHVKTMVLTVLSVLLVSGTFLAGFWVGQKQGIETAAGEDKARLEKLLKEQQDEMALLRQEAAKKKELDKVSTTQVGDLTFYNELPNQSVKPSPLHADATVAIASRIQQKKLDLQSETEAMRQVIEAEMRQPKVELETSVSTLAAAASSPRQPQVKPSGFMLQVASFQKQVDADAFLSKLTKQGFSPLVRRVELSDMGVWYRVYLTGYTSKEAANKAKKEVKKSLNITAFVLKAN